MDKDISQVLFRPEVEHAKRLKYDAEIHLEVPFHTKLASCVAGVSFFCLLALAFLASYSVQKPIKGRLEPASGVVSVSAPQAGIVARLLVVEGQVVLENQPIAELHSEIISLNGDSSGDKTREQLRLELSAVDVQLKEYSQLASLKRDDSQSNIFSLQRQLQHEQNKLRIIEERIESDEKIHGRMKKLAADKFISQLQIEQQGAALLSLKLERESILNRNTVLAADLSSAKRQLISLGYESAKFLNALQTQSAEIKSRIVQNDTQARFVIRAPKKGLITTIIAKTGQSMKVNDNIMSIMVDRSPLTAVFYISSDMVPFVKLRGTLPLKVDAYPYQVHGTLPGRVVSISSAPVDPSDIVNLTGAQQSQPMYRLLVEPEPNAERTNTGKLHERLKPGMGVKAELTLDRRRIYQWALFKAEATWKEERPK